MRRGQIEIRDCVVRSLPSAFVQGIDISFGFDLAPSVVEGCTVTGGLEGIVTHFARVLVRDNHVSNTELRAITMTEMSMGKIEDNEVDGAVRVGIFCGDYSHCEIEDNAVADVVPDPSSDDPMRHGVAIQSHFGAEAEPGTTRSAAARAGSRRFPTPPSSSAEPVPARLQLIARTGHPTFLDLPWDEPLAEWESERLVEVVRGIHRHVVRFVEYESPMGPAIYAVKELPEPIARREYGPAAGGGRDARRRGGRRGHRTRRGARIRPDHAAPRLLAPVSHPVRARQRPDLRRRLLDAGAELLVRLHLGGFFWGDCLSNTLFRRDAGALAAYLVDAETGEPPRAFPPASGSTTC